MNITTEQGGFVFPLLPLRGLVLLPKMTLHFDVGRKKSIAALDAAMNSSQLIFLTAQKDITVNEPEISDLYAIGCVAKIKQILRMPDGSARVVAVGKYRAKIGVVMRNDPCFYAEAVKLEDPAKKVSPNMSEALSRKIRELFDRYASENPKMAPDIALTVASSDEPGYLSDFVAFNLNMPDDDKQYILEQTDVIKRAKLILQMLERECQIQKIDSRINEKVKCQLDENQKEYYLREQMKAISSELYGDEDQAEIDKYYSKIDALPADNSVKERLRAEVAKLAKMPQGSHEGTVSTIYIETCLSLPWNYETKSVINTKKARKILDRDFYSMDKIKDRIVEMLAVYKKAPDITGQILCLAGPPGVGKTNIAKTVAECMGRKYVRIALGGVHDEAEIRGHRKTYIGAMPGRIIDAIKRAGCSNPLILLDEVDKLGKDYKGDPSSALLEVLDPEQNKTFTDHFVDMPYDLSKVVFIATANDISSIPDPLFDRMEVISLAGYTEAEKLNIAKRHLVKKEMNNHGLTPAELKITDDAINCLIDNYTRESGVRELQRRIASVCRKTAKSIIDGEITKATVRAADVKKLLGTEIYHDDFALKQDEVGVINGLAWTAAGGRLMGLEVVVMEGTGKIELTGSLGDVMKESAHSAVTCVRSKAEQLGIDPMFYKTKDIHIHATESAVPKDGPSAGVTITAALVSALTGRKVRHDVALTGEVSIRGRVFPIGGLKEKSMAAMRSKISTVLIPYDNVSDLNDIDKEVKDAVRFIPCRTIEDVLEYVLEPLVESDDSKKDIIPETKSREFAAIRQ